MSIKLICGDSLEMLKTLPSESVNCVMTSPPYWALRDYGIEPQVWGGTPDCQHEFNLKEIRTGQTHWNKGGKLIPYKERKIRNGTKREIGFCLKCGAWKGSLGLEPTFNLFISHLCDIFDEVKRVLKRTGSCWVNIGDAYAGLKVGKTDKKVADYVKDTQINLRKDCQEIENKNLCLIPFRFALEMQNRGWILRNVIIWHKPNCMPSSVKDRFTVDFEYLFFFVKNKKYWFETQYELAQECSIARLNRAVSNKNKWVNGANGQTPHNLSQPKPNRNYKGGDGVGRKNNCAISTYQFEEGDYLVSPWDPKKGRNKRCVWTITTKPYKEAHFATYPEALCETPIKAGCPKDGTVLDLFCGSGTTGTVAKRLGRNFIGIELNPTYIKLAEKRINKVQEDMFVGVK